MKRLKTIYNSLALVVAAQLTWAFMALVPVTWFWFEPMEYFVSDGTPENVPTISFDRVIKREVKMTYHVSVRSLGPNSGAGRVVCDPTNGPFTYRPTAELPDEIDLIWWTGGDDRCWPQEPGTYVSETCWTVVRPFWGLVPPKTVCRRSNVFTISAETSRQAT